MGAPHRQICHPSPASWQEEVGPSGACASAPGEGDAVTPAQGILHLEFCFMHWIRQPRIGAGHRQNTRLKVDPKPLFFLKHFCLSNWFPWGTLPALPLAQLLASATSHTCHSTSQTRALPVLCILPAPSPLPPPKSSTTAKTTSKHKTFGDYDTTTRCLRPQLSVLQKEEKQRPRPISISCDHVPGGLLPKPGLCTARPSPRTCGAMTKAGS